MKKLLIVLTILLSLSVGVFASDSVTTVQILGIMNGDTNGNMNLENPVNRAEFAKMLVTASTERDTKLGAGSVFSDVKADHWASAYVKLAVEEGWVSGYTDGSYRPSNSITAPEAYAMVLRLLGYDTTSLSGNFSTAILDLANKVGLTDDITNEGTFLRSDCAQLFANAMACYTADGTYYGQTLGYIITNGELDISSVALADLKGPYVYDGTWSGTTPTTVYLNGEVVTGLSTYDVYYVNNNTAIAYGYNDRVYGTITAIAGGTAAPTGVTVQGVDYTVSTNGAKLKLSTGGSIQEGQMVTLLLGMDGSVVDILDNVEATKRYYGLVQSTAYTENGIQLTVFCTDGTTRTFDTTNSYIDAGSVVEVSFVDGVEVAFLAQNTMSGDVTTAAFGRYKFASNVEIVDTLHDRATKVYPAQLAGYSLSSTDVYTYQLNENNEISHLILKNATGNLVEYGYLFDRYFTESISSGTYSVWQNGVTSTFYSAATEYLLTEDWGYGFELGKDNNVNEATKLSGYLVTKLSGLAAEGGGVSLEIAEDVQVLVKAKTYGSDYFTMDMADINLNNYTVTAMRDNYSAGQKVRILYLEPII